MNSKFYKWCAVSQCKNTSIKTPSKVFIYVPHKKQVRIKWLTLARRDPGTVSLKSTIYFCEDHFDLPNDMENYIQYRVMGTVDQIRMKPGCIPTRFKFDLDKSKQKTAKCLYDTSNKEEDYHSNYTQHNLNEDTKPNTLLVCRVCLGSDAKLLPIRKYNLEQTYIHVTGYDDSKVDYYPQYMCIECAQKLNNCREFINKCAKSQIIMMDLMQEHNQLTLDNLKTIDRQSHKLTSNLSMQNISTNNIIHIESNIDVIEENATQIYIKNDRDDKYLTEYSQSNVIVEKSEMPKIVEKIETKIQENKIDKRRKAFSDNDNIFTVTELMFEEQVAEFQKRRESSNYRNSNLKCTYCYRGFLSEETYNRHMKQHTNENGEYICEVCKIHYKTIRDLRHHKSQHHTQKYNCTRCPFVTSRRHTARLHGRLHMGTKYHCQHCQDEFLQFTTYMSHLRIKHPSDFVCPWCGFCFVSAKGLEQHKRLKHRFDDSKISENGPHCDACDIGFVSQDAFKKHLSVSNKHRNYKKIRNAPQRTLPVRKRRESIETITCEMCGVELSGMGVYAQHFRRKHPGKVRTQYPIEARNFRPKCICEHCGKAFSKLSTLKLHMWVHTGEKMFHCDHCNKSFSQKNSLEFHIHSIHNPPGTFKARRHRLKHTVNN